MEDRMKKLLAVTGVILIFCVIWSAAAVNVPSRSGGEDKDTQTASYTVCTENNRVVVYRGDALWLKTDTLVSDLPKGDRLRLERGIVVNSESELKSLIEDYCS